MKDEWDGLPTDAFASQTCFGIALNEDKKLDLEHKFLLLGSAFLMVNFKLKVAIVEKIFDTRGEISPKIFFSKKKSAISGTYVNIGTFGDMRTEINVFV
jgi:hypothetical protein